LYACVCYGNETCPGAAMNPKFARGLFEEKNHRRR
jgi:hypothetical protein